MRIRTTIRFIVPLIAMLLLVGMVAGCGGGGGGSTHEPTDADLSVSLRVGPFSDPGTGPCTGHVVWRLSPVSLTGSSGKSTEQVVDRDYEVQPSLVGPGEWYCFFNDVVGGLRVGDWRVSAQTPVWGTSCETMLLLGRNIANFTQYRQGCVDDGFGYPGDQDSES